VPHEAPEKCARTRRKRAKGAADTGTYLRGSQFRAEYLQFGITRVADFSKNSLFFRNLLVLKLNGHCSRGHSESFCQWNEIFERSKMGHTMVRLLCFDWARQIRSFSTGQRTISMIVNSRMYPPVCDLMSHGAAAPFLSNTLSYYNLVRGSIHIARNFVARAFAWNAVGFDELSMKKISDNDIDRNGYKLPSGLWVAPYLIALFARVQQVVILLSVEFVLRLQMSYVHSKAQRRS
jgi:hypothetical protein